jgi:hypothetical protein
LITKGLLYSRVCKKVQIIGKSREISLGREAWEDVCGENEVLQRSLVGRSLKKSAIFLRICTKISQNIINRHMGSNFVIGY